MISFDCRLARADFILNAAFEAGSGITALFGPSGSGKSTILRLIAGLERPQQGKIRIHDTMVLDTDAAINLAPHQRRIGFVFQDAQLFPHLSVRANLTYGQGFTPRPARRIGFDAVVEVLGIGALLSRAPDSLSGGERQRVAIGRALLSSPRLLLMDEPLASLDAARKHEILPFIERLRDEFALPVIYVSHAVEEVVRLAAKVVQLEGGQITAIGTPDEVLTPALARSGDRFDVFSLLTGTVERYLPDHAVTILRHPAGEIIVPGRIDPTPARMRLAIRATNVTLCVGPPGQISVRTALKGRLLRLDTDAGPFALAHIELTGGEILRACTTRLASDQLGLAIGQEVQALVKAVSMDESGIAGLHSARD